MGASGYDIIGDVHGHAEKLEALLTQMGYEQRNGAWRHPDRTVIFVGDLVDRGPRQLDTIDIARRMVDAGTAQIVAGNHEFNAIGWQRGLRPPIEKNRAQHHAFLDAVGEGSADHVELIDWFTQLPLWLDLGDLRVVHACWDPASIDHLQGRGGAGALSDPSFVRAAHDRDSPEWRAIEHLLKGPEVELAPSPSYRDKGGHCRDSARWSWWDPAADNLRQGARIPPGTRTVDDDPYPELPADRLDELPVPPYRDEVPVFFGHYWFSGRPTLAAPHAACLDYSAGKDGPLVAYRWRGETELSVGNFVSTRSAGKP